MFGGFGMYVYGKRLVRHTQKYVRKHGTIRGSGLGKGILAGIFSYFV